MRCLAMLEKTQKPEVMLLAAATVILKIFPTKNISQ